MTKISGSCLCGDVHYEGEIEPKFMANCHCTDCRKASAARHMSLMLVSKDDVTMTGTLASYDVTADSGSTVTHHFCPKCGSPMYNTNSKRASGMVLVATTLDNPDIFSPQVIVYASSALPWDPPMEGVPKFDKMPA